MLATEVTSSAGNYLPPCRRVFGSPLTRILRSPHTTLLIAKIFTSPCSLGIKDEPLPYAWIGHVLEIAHCSGALRAKLQAQYSNFRVQLPQLKVVRSTDVVFH